MSNMGIDLTEMKGVGDTLKESLQEQDIESVEELAAADPHVLTNIKGIQIKRAQNLVGYAEDHLDEVWVDRQWDGNNEEWYDAGKNVYECECGFRVQSKNAFDSHQDTCTVRNDRVECDKCGYKHFNVESNWLTLEDGDYCPKCGTEIGSLVEEPQE